jgi:hypothetical protein
MEVVVLLLVEPVINVRYRWGWCHLHVRVFPAILMKPVVRQVPFLPG